MFKDEIPAVSSIVSVNKDGQYLRRSKRATIWNFQEQFFHHCPKPNRSELHTARCLLNIHLFLFYLFSKF